jgi:hypothetical protein
MVNYMCTQKGVQWKFQIQHTGTRSPQHDRSAACVTAHQYSLATFVSLRFHSCKEKSGERFKYVILHFLGAFAKLPKYTIRFVMPV